MADDVAKGPDYQEWESRSLGDLPVLDDAARAAMPGLISTDSHVAEPDDLWKQNLPERLSKNIPRVKIGLPIPGATDPKARIVDQERDGLAAEVLFRQWHGAVRPRRHRNAGRRLPRL